MCVCKASELRDHNYSVYPTGHQRTGRPRRLSPIDRESVLIIINQRVSSATVRTLADNLSEKFSTVARVARVHYETKLFLFP